MQSIQAKEVYGNALNCVRIILREEGMLAFWAGIWHRLGRLSVASAIMFPV
jgi:solute carrier family 25 citrate transporter 1